ncbi:hypothetical protein, partial [Achromobacter xylosoxidans]|uniref:hypothetical protein n=1 Tax=Alcaligenes xylosoxydans xylosoxydans TaxID=85698 RepID=UPI001F143B7A
MTQQDDITQRVLPAEHHLNELMRLTQPWPNATIPCATVRSHVEQALSKLRAPVADERAAVDPCGYVAVKVSAVDWLKDKFPALTIKAGLCERIGGRLYTITRLMRDHDTALASAPVADAIQWPTMPESKGQSPILFEDGYAEGWAKCMDECRRAVSQASAPVAGEAQPSDAEVLKVYAETVAEYADGRGFEAGTVAFARSLLRRYAAPQASAEYERGHADGWAAGWDQAIKQPQADKDGAEQALKDLVTHGVSVQRIAPADFLAGGQQRAGDVDERAAFEAWAYRA